MKKQIDGQINIFDYISSEDKSNIGDIENIKVISLYKECINCWCSTCKHNAKGKALPRDFAGEKSLAHPVISALIRIKQISVKLVLMKMDAN